MRAPMRAMCGPAVDGDIEGRLFADYSRVYLTHKGRTAIYLACGSLGVMPGDVVLAPAYNCGSEIDPLLFAGAQVVLYNIDRSLRFDLAEIERLITPRVRAVYVTHYWGFPYDLAPLRALCAAAGIAIIEDCAHCLWSRYPGTGVFAGRAVGLAGDFSVFSLMKSLPAPDGGALVINSTKYEAKWEPLFGMSLRELIARAASLTKPSFTRSPALRGLRRRLRGRGAVPPEGGAAVPDVKTRPGIPRDYYFTPGDAHAGLADISRRFLSGVNRGEVVERRRRNFLLLIDLLRDIKGIRLVFDELGEGVSPLIMPLIVDNRDEKCEKLREMGIDAAPWWGGYHKSLPWEAFPDACYLKDSVLALPVHQCLDDRAIYYIGSSLREVSARG